MILTDILDYGYNGEKYAYQLRGNRAPALLNLRQSRSGSVGIPKGRTQVVDIIPHGNVSRSSLAVQADWSDNLPQMNPKGEVIYTFRELPVVGRDVNVMFEATVDSSTTFKQEWSIVVDLSQMLQGAVVLATQFWAVDSYTRRAVMFVTGFLPGTLPVWKMSVKWDCNHAGSPDATEDTFTVSFLATFHSVSSGFSWRALMPGDPESTPSEGELDDSWDVVV